ncbi:MAG: hypothetical protein QM725_09015 [Lacibacter sp.]
MKKLMPVVFILLCFSARSQSSDTIKVNTDSVYTKPDTEAQFPEGETKWNEYVKKTIEANIKTLVDDPKSNGVCTVNFIVDRDGSILAAVAVNMQGSELARIFVKAILKGPKWIPATVNGIPVKSLRKQKAIFKSAPKETF